MSFFPPKHDHRTYHRCNRSNHHLIQTVTIELLRVLAKELVEADGE